MTANTTTNKGIYLGQGIAPFPERFAFATNESASNKIFLPSLKGVVEISAQESLGKMQAETQAKESFFGMFPSIALD
jgi:hypothetical protein